MNRRNAIAASLGLILAPLGAFLPGFIYQKGKQSEEKPQVCQWHSTEQLVDEGRSVTTVHLAGYYLGEEKVTTYRIVRIEYADGWVYWNGGAVE